MFSSLVLWWFLAEVLGLAAFPLAFRLLRFLPDRGYAFTKPLGLVLLSYLLWLGASLHVLPFSQRITLLWLLVLVILAAFLYWRGRAQFRDFWREKRWHIVSGEVLFLAFFLGMGVMRAYNPEISHTEQPMDLAFLSSILQGRYFPPQDPWLSGFTINYYYFGYHMVAVMARLSGIAVGVSYNLALALLFALTALGAYGLVANLVALAEKRLGGRAIAFGVVAALLVVALANLEGVLELVRAQGWGSEAFWKWVGIKDLTAASVSPSWHPTDFWWWWHASRVIDTVVDGRSLDYTINEFPFFSFLLGDLHPHVMALPLGPLALALALNAFVSPKESRPWWRPRPALLGVALVLGGIAVTNFWDFPGYLFLLALAAALGVAWRQGGVRGWAGWGLGVGLVILGSFLLYLPFYLSYDAPSVGAWPLWPGKGVGTRPLHYAIVWGPFLLVGLSFLAALAPAVISRSFLRQNLWKALAIPLALLLAWDVGLLAVGTLGSVPGRLSLLLPLAALLALLVLLLLKKAGDMAGEPHPGLFALALLFLGFLLTFGVELFYVADLFGNRMNTVFKLYYQAWVLLALASAFGLYYLSSHWPAGRRWRAGQYVWGVLLVAIMAAALFYPVAATYSKADAFRPHPTLDGLAWAKAAHPAEAEALSWLQEVALPGSVIVEAVGGSYSEYGRISARTGLPAVLGWPWHETQWRGSDQAYRGREQDVEAIYRSTSAEQARPLLEKYGVRYVYVGYLERAKYGAVDLSAFLEVAYQKDEVTIYRVKGPYGQR